MNRFDRVRAALRGDSVDRVPVALWRHYPGADDRAEQFRQAHLAWQSKWDWDFLKITPASGYPYEPWGAKFTYTPNDRGVRQCIEETRPVKATADWGKIKALPVREGLHGELVRGTELIVRDLGREVPTLQTIFSPSFTVLNFAGKERFLQDLRERPGAVKSAFDAVTETTIALAKAYLDAGVTGMFFSTLLASATYMPADEYTRTCAPYDRAVLDAIRGRTDFILLHLHGEDVYFDLASAYPVDAVNWHDRSTPPTLAEGRRTSGRCVVGGISEAALLANNPDQVAEQARSAIQETGGRGILLATGCVTPVTAPETNLRAAREAVEKVGV